VVLMGFSRGGIAGLAPMLVRRIMQYRSPRQAKVSESREMKR